MHRESFPIFATRPGLIYLDSAATTLKPQAAIDALREYGDHYSGNVGRGLYPLAEETTARFETVREQVASFIKAAPQEIIFTSGTTHGLNMAARLLEPRIDKGASVVTTALDHHSNYLPWKEMALRREAAFVTLPFSETGLDLANLPENALVVAFPAISNVTGLAVPVEETVRAIRMRCPRTLVIVDAAQAAGHRSIDVRAWDADFVAFSAHKMFGATGTGVLFGKRSLLERLSSVEFGGGMVLDATLQEPIYREIPYRFEAGTPNVAGILALGAAIDFIDSLGWEKIQTHEASLISLARASLVSAFGKKIRIYGPGEPKFQGSVLAFTLDGVHPHDIAQLLGEKEISIRAGEHCAAPLHRILGIGATSRLSVSVYNTREDIERFVSALKEAVKILVL